MKGNANTRVLMFGAWSALFYPGLMILGWWIFAGFVPPTSPSATANEIVSIHSGNALGIRIGMVIAMIGAMMAMPLGATNAHLISRIEGFFGPLSILHVMGAVGMAVLTFYPPMWWLIASFRLERTPELTQTLNDAAWLQWVGGLTLYYPTIITIAIASLIDKSKEPAYPRWFAYFNLLMVVLMLPGQMIFFFKQGPFAWNGLLAFYLPFLEFALWFPMAFVIMRKAVRRLGPDLALTD